MTPPPEMPPETPTTDFVTIFDDTYDRPDCRAYFRMMDALGYRNQHHAVAAFRAGLDEVTRLRGITAPRIFESYDEILDHCCDAWNKLIDQPDRIASIGCRAWAQEF